MKDDRLYVGIDTGSVSVNGIVINQDEEIVYEVPYRRHFGRVEDSVFELLKEIYERFGKENIRTISFTGNHGRKFSNILDSYYEFDTISQVLGALKVVPDVRTIISMGGQDTELFQISHSGSGWELEYFNTNGPCASGTGSFIDQQAQRLATSIYSEDVHISQEDIDRVLKDFIGLGLRSDRPANVACRCTVFTKSDMIHLQNRGERLEDIIYGLHVGNARNYISTIVGNRRLKEPIIFIGGLSLNKLQVKAFKEYFPNLIIPPYNTSIGALGVALQALKRDKEGEKRESRPTAIIDLKRLDSIRKEQTEELPTAPRLELKLTHFPEADEIRLKNISKKERVYIGIDVGSTTTKYAVIDENREIVHKCYVPTQGRPIEVTQHLLKVIRDEIGDRIEIAGTATTGSGRNVIGDFLNVDLIIDEITAHARGAVEIDPDVDTIFEIGGQDSKYIYIQNRHPLDFDMNKVCAAGTGSFLHELANKYGINIVGEFQDIALSSQAPIRLTERCTVFMESDLVSYHQRGMDIRDLMAGLCYAIVYNYLNRVVGRRKIGKKVMFLGGPSLNKGVVAAFENVLKRQLIVPPHREVLGAYGAAISVQENMKQEGKVESSFRGLDSAINDRMEYKERICNADPNCSNQCKLKIYDFGGRKSIWGGECGRYETSRTRWKRRDNYFALRQKIWDSYMKEVCIELKEEPILEWNGRPTVGVQRALYMHHVGIFWAYFFHYLGFQPVITPPTNPRISKIGIESMVTETCYPVKVSHGHVKELMGKTRYLFLPSIINMPAIQDSEVAFYCPMVQSNSYMLRSALGIDKKKLLAPIVHMKHDISTLSVELHEQMGKRLGIRSKEIKRAIAHAMERQEEFQRELYRKGEEILNNIGNDEHVLIVTGRPYNLYDERLNLRLGQNLAKIGFNALPIDFIDISSVDLSDFPSMYWGLGSRILRAARLVSMTPNYFGLHLTNFSCGADSFLEHFYKHIMGNKPYLILELDEHSAVAGVMTRLEAYRNVIDNAIKEVKPQTAGLKAA
ncbi:MAG: CoA activase [Deltaproteobacteria bacterium]|nr:MAG: CoA activase [Deltaproteobacteria bacterium]